MNALIDDTHGEETYGRPGEGARKRNVLVVALDAVIPTHLSGTKVLVVAPALNSWLRRWLSTFPADEILIAAQPGRSSQIAEELGSRAQARFALPAFRAGESLSKAA